MPEERQDRMREPRKESYINRLLEDIMSATKRDSGIGDSDAGDGSKVVPHDKDAVQDIDPDQDPIRPAVAHERAKEKAAEQAKEGSGAQAKEGSSAQANGGAPFAPRDIDPDQNGTRPC